MSAFLTYCGFYCALTAFVGMYFFAVLAVMEYRENQSLAQFWQAKAGTMDEQPKQHDKMIAFIILIGIEFVLVLVCYFCGSASAKQDALDEEEELKRQEGKEYRRV